MKKLAYSLFLLCFLAFVIGIFDLIKTSEAQIAPADRETEILLEKRIETFFNDLKNSNGSAKTALEELLRDSPLSSRNSAEMIDAMNVKYTDLKSSEVGTLQSWERIQTTPLGKDAIIMKCLFKYDNFPVVWYFTFYHPPKQTVSGTPSNTGWYVIGLRFDTNLEPLSL